MDRSFASSQGDSEEKVTFQLLLLLLLGSSGGQKYEKESVTDGSS
jgi:hypothetical protein